MDVSNLMSKGSAQENFCLLTVPVIGGWCDKEVMALYVTEYCNCHLLASYHSGILKSSMWDLVMSVFQSVSHSALC